MKITFVLPSYHNVPAGGRKVVYEYANELVRTGSEVTIVYLRRFGRPSLFRSLIALFKMLFRYPVLLLNEIKKPEITWYNLHGSVKVVRATNLRARQVPNADAIVATWWRTAAWVSDCPRAKGAKFHLVMDFAPWMADQRELEQTWRLPLKKIAISGWLAEVVLQSGVPEEDVKAIPIAVDHRLFRSVNRISGRAKRVAMLYSPQPYKRSELGLSVLTQCKNLVPDLQSSLFGPAHRRPPELPSWIKYHDNLSDGDLVELYNSASVYLCSSAVEGFALPPAEAMACGCAVVTTDCGGNREYAEQGKTALVSDPEDVAGLTDNVVRLLSDEAFMVRLASAGRDRIAAFTWEQSTQQLIDFLKRYV
ncbi:MAG: glycosyltransferase family 4 protein [Halobacteriota archaeon]